MTDRLVPDGLNATLVLLRHGESVAITEGRFQGQLNTPLSPLGERQAVLAGERIANPGRPPHIAVPTSAPVEIVHSPLARTALTASSAGQALRAAYGPAAPVPRPEAGLLEVGQGAWEGLHRDEVESRYPAELASWRRAPTEPSAPGAEPLAVVDLRVRAALAAILARLAAAAVPVEVARTSAAGYPPPSSSPTWSLLVGHDGVFKVALLALFDLPLERFWSFGFGLTGITIVGIHDGSVVLRAHNLLDHLAPLQVVGPEPDVAEDRAESGAL
ncbi:MAG: histidine phosphatase family protein [Candidatus Limnocylindrales bacterium]